MPLPTWHIYDSLTDQHDAMQIIAGIAGGGGAPPRTRLIDPAGRRRATYATSPMRRGRRANSLWIVVSGLSTIWWRPGSRLSLGRKEKCRIIAPATDRLAPKGDERENNAAVIPDL